MIHLLLVLQILFAIGGGASSLTPRTSAFTETPLRKSTTDSPEVSVMRLTGRRLLQIRGNVPETALVFMLNFAAQPSQSDSAVQIAVQYAVASANTPLPVSTSAVDVGSAVYNVTVLFPAGNQVLSKLPVSTTCGANMGMPCQAILCTGVCQLYSGSSDASHICCTC